MNELHGQADSAKFIWQSQALEAPRLTAWFVRVQAERLNADHKQQIRMIDGALIGCVVLVAVTLWNPRGVPSALVTVARLSAVLTLAYCVYVGYEFRRRSTVITCSGVLQGLEAYRAELKRRRDYYHNTWRWGIWPMTPLLLVVFIGGALYDQRPAKTVRYIAIAVFVIVGTALGTAYSRRRGDEFQRELDALASLERD